MLLYTNTTLELQHLNNSGQSAIVAPENKVLKEAYGLRIRIGCETTACNRGRTSFFINPAYAFSCGCEAPIQYHPKDSVTGLKVITLNDFDALHPAGSDITARFKMFSGYVFTDLAGYLESKPPVFNAHGVKNIVLDALLMEPAAQTGNHRFRVEVDLSDGRVLETETSMVELL